jgi:hypothetical protein
VFENHKHEKVPRHHLWSTGQPSLSIILFSLSSRTMAKKGKRGFKFTIAKLERLQSVINEIVPIGNPDWEKVWHEHLAAYPTMEGTPELLKHKF